MSDYIRAKFAGGLYFSTLVTFNRQPFLTSPLARKILRVAWKDVQNRYPFEVDAICLLSDHFHCIWRLPEGDANFSKRWMSIKAIFSKKYKAMGGQETQLKIGRILENRKMVEWDSTLQNSLITVAFISLPIQLLNGMEFLIHWFCRGFHG